MLEMRFFAANSDEVLSIELRGTDYKKLIDAGFAKVCVSRAAKVILDGENVVIDAIKLGKKNRASLAKFLSSEVLACSRKLAFNVSDIPTQLECEDGFRYARLLFTLLDSINDSKFIWFERC